MKESNSPAKPTIEPLGSGLAGLWSAAPCLPAALLRHYADQAGVHRYVDTGEQVLAGPGFLALHAAFAGERRVRLPRPARVADAVTGQVVGEGLESWTCRLQRGETAIWTVAG